MDHHHFGYNTKLALKKPLKLSKLCKTYERREAETMYIHIPHSRGQPLILPAHLFSLPTWWWEHNLLLKISQEYGSILHKCWCLLFKCFASVAKEEGVGGGYTKYIPVYFPGELKGVYVVLLLRKCTIYSYVSIQDNWCLIFYYAGQLCTAV